MKTVLVLGANPVGFRWARAFHRLGRLSGIAGPHVHELDLTHSHGIDMFDNYDEALATRKYSAVVVATAGMTRTHLTERILQSGHDVLLPPPLADTLEDALYLADVAREEGRILMVGHLTPYQNGLRHAKQMVDSGIIGPLEGLYLERTAIMPSMGQTSPFRDAVAADLSTLLSITGSFPMRERAYSERSGARAPEDGIFLHLWFHEGLQAHYRVSKLWPESVHRIAFTGSTGMLVYNFRSQAISMFQRESKDGWKQEERLIYPLSPGERGAQAMLDFVCRQFLATLEDRVVPMTDGDHGAAVVRLLEQSLRLASEAAVLNRESV